MLGKKRKNELEKKMKGTEGVGVTLRASKEEIFFYFF
jgi:hypothetical protein